METFPTIFWYLDWINWPSRLSCLFKPQIYTECITLGPIRKINYHNVIRVKSYKVSTTIFTLHVRDTFVVLNTSVQYEICFIFVWFYWSCHAYFLPLNHRIASLVYLNFTNIVPLGLANSTYTYVRRKSKHLCELPYYLCVTNFIWIWNIKSQKMVDLCISKSLFDARQTFSWKVELLHIRDVLIFWKKCVTWKLGMWEGSNNSKTQKCLT